MPCVILDADWHWLGGGETQHEGCSQGCRRRELHKRQQAAEVRARRLLVQQRLKRIRMPSSWPEQQHRCHNIVMVTRARPTESPAPNLGPRTTMITPLALRNRATPIPPTMAPPAPTAR